MNLQDDNFELDELLIRGIKSIDTYSHPLWVNKNHVPHIIKKLMAITTRSNTEY